MSDLKLCGPFVCDFPDPAGFRWGQHWTCPRCGTTYRRARRIRDYRWRRVIAPAGFWVVAWIRRKDNSHRLRWEPPR